MKGPGSPHWTWRAEVLFSVARQGTIRILDVPVARIRRVLARSPRPYFLRRRVTHARDTLAGRPTEVHTPRGWTSEGTTMLYLHGGGYSVGSPATHRDLISRLAWSTGCRCIALDYRKAPEEPFPAALDDTLAAIRELASQDVATRTLWLGGDSAGGGLTMATLLVLRDEGAEMPAGAVLLSPWVDLTEAAMDPVPDNEHDYLFSGILERFSGDYTTQENRQDPRVSPVLGNLHGLPPLLIQAGEVEIFLPQVRRLAERARDAGVDVVLEVGEGMVHVFQAFAWFLPEARQAIHSLGLLVRARLSEEDGVVQIEAGESEPGVVKVVKVDG